MTDQRITRLFVVPALLLAGGALAQDGGGDAHKGHSHGEGSGVSAKQGGGHGGDDHVGHNHGGGDGGGPDVVQDEKTRYGSTVDPDAKLSIEFGTDKHDFGRVRQGQVLEHTFQLESGGTSDLVIRQAKPTCGCTLSRVAVEGEDGAMADYQMGEPIPPGRKIEITAGFDTKSKRNKTDVRINVYTNDPVGLVQLGLSANVEPFLTVTPQFLNLGELAEDATKTEVIDIRTTSGESIALALDDSPKPKPEGLEVSLEPQSPDAEGKSSHWKATVQIGPGLKEGPLGYGIVLKSDEPMEGATPGPDGTIPTYVATASMNGRVLGAISCSPQYLSMGLVRPGQVVGRSVRLTSNDPEFQLDQVGVEITGAKNPDGTISFVGGVPLFGTLIGLMFRGLPVLGCIHQPVSKLLCVGDGVETSLNGERCRVRDTASIAEAVARLDAALGVPAVLAQVPFADSAVRARHGIGPPHDARDRIAHREAAARGRLHHAPERLMPDDEAPAPRRRRVDPPRELLKKRAYPGEEEEAEQKRLVGAVPAAPALAE